MMMPLNLKHIFTYSISCQRHHHFTFISYYGYLTLNSIGALKCPVMKINLSNILRHNQKINKKNKKKIYNVI